MAKGRLLTKDWFVALVFSLLFLVGLVNDTSLFEGLEHTAYDFGVRADSRPPAGEERVVIVSIDEQSIQQIGSWPWPRSELAGMLTRLSAARPQVIGLHLPLSEQQNDAGLDYLRRLEPLLGKVAQSGQIGTLLRQAEQELNTDRRLAEAIASAGNVLLPMVFTLGHPPGNPVGPLPDYVQRQQLTRVFDRSGKPGNLPPTRALRAPLAEFARPAAGIGHVNVFPDDDGALRREALALQFDGNFFPSMALLLVAKSLNLRPADISVNLGEGVQLGSHTIPTDATLRMYPSFTRRADGGAPFPQYSFSDVRNGKVPAAQFTNRIVLIGASAPGIGERRATPVNDSMDAATFTAHSVTSLLDQRFYTRPDWVWLAEAGMFLTVALYLILLLPRLPGTGAALLSLTLLALLLAGGHYLLLRDQLWLKTVSPALLLLSGHLLLTAKGYFMSVRRERRFEIDSDSNNRMLGLAFQNQGQLDMALDKFRALPANDSVLELIYNLALDYERKRQFSKAASAYDYILQHNPTFRDAPDRRQRAARVEHTLLLGGGRSGAAGTLLLDQVDHKPTLGRYIVEKELGKGTMGIVYLGRDPTINRVVAIKTLALSEEFEGTDLAQAKERFFREAETAGRLNHPNIVTIYDAGEDHDLAYIAMEYLDGGDLTGYTSKKQLLPVDSAVDIVCKVAEALAYAHQQGVVHRDIKPANIMYDPKHAGVKVTDFGIARITAATRTRTGVVLGTPSYMSPEQLGGKPVDGRSDLFSLGVMTFELLTGKLPFEGETLAALMYQIANLPHPDITTLRKGLPPCLAEMMDMALAKDPKARFQTGEEFSQALRTCAQGKTSRKKKARAA